jgi:UDP-N-acetylglucosamine 2-epimerase (non-hydrolysing)
LKKKITFVFGTRPEAIKMAALINALRTESNYETFVILTGQHPEMARQVLEWFEIKPDIEHQIDRSENSLNSLSSQIIAKVGLDLVLQNPDMVVVQGDTASAFAGAIAAFNLQIPVAHLEAGLRTHNIDSPFPEEAYRQMVSRIANVHFCPTQGNADNLVSEGISLSYAMVTGNTVVDAFSVIQAKISNNQITLKLPKTLPKENLVLVTAHRRENLEHGMTEIAEAISTLSEIFPNLNFVVPMHPNPVVRKRLIPKLSGKVNVLLLEPLEYPEFISILSKAKFVLTDSGGVQEEAPILRVPALVLRENTERPEGLLTGSVRMVGVSREIIVETVRELMSSNSALESMSNASNPYGDGQASQRCISLLNEFFDLGERIAEFRHV